MALVELAAYADRSLAEIVGGRLASEGIACVLFDGGLAGLGLGHMTPVRLMVAREDRAAAEGLLAADNAY